MRVRHISIAAKKDNLRNFSKSLFLSDLLQYIKFNSDSDNSNRNYTDLVDNVRNIVDKHATRKP